MREVARSFVVRLLGSLLLAGVGVLPLVGLAPAVAAQPATPASLAAPAASGTNQHGVNLVSPAVVRVISDVSGQVICKRCASDGSTITFPLSGGSYNLAFSGTGVFISPDGYILTADHVVDYDNNQDIVVDFFNAAVNEVAQTYGYTQSQAQQLLLQLYDNGQISIPTQVTSQKAFLSTAYTGQLQNSAQVTSYDVTRIIANSPWGKQDTAVVKVEASDVPYVKLAPQTTVSVQDNITAIAFPGDADTGDFTALFKPTDSDVNSINSLLGSSVNNGQITAEKTWSDGTQVYETSGIGSFGSSGGPVVNEKGELVGFIDAISATSGSRVVYMVPSDVARSYLRQAGVENAAGGTFMTEWTKAISEYDATGPCHFTNAAKDLRKVKNDYPQFGGVQSFLKDATARATPAECPASTPLGLSSGPALLIGIIAGLILLAIVVFLVLMLIRRGRRQPQPVAVAPGLPPAYGTSTASPYAQQPLPPGYPGNTAYPGYTSAPATPAAPLPQGAPSQYAPGQPTGQMPGQVAGSYTPSATPQAVPAPAPGAPATPISATPVGVPYAAPPVQTPPPQQGYVPPASAQPRQPAPVARTCANGHLVSDPAASFCPVCGSHVQ